VKRSRDSAARRIAAHWDRRTLEAQPERTRWWQSRAVRRHVNRLVSGQEYEGTGEGLVMVLRERLRGRVLRRGVSIGCGIGNKEMRFVRLGLVERFDLFELSSARIEQGRALAGRLGIGQRVTFHRDDGFSVVAPESVDLVHWNNSLHHMLDVRRAVEWSRRVLAPGGVFFLDDFVGPTRFQWSDRAIAVATGVRAMLPRRFLEDPASPPDKRRHLPVEVKRPNASRLARRDPSEAADSAAILPAVRDLFPEAEIQRTGGLVYHVALATILHNFDEEDAEDLALLDLLLELDTACLRDPELESPYATALAERKA